MRLFVYGTLQSAALCKAVSGGEVVSRTPATLPDYTVLPVAKNVVPLIRKAVGRAATGLILDGITEDQLTRLNAYEGAFGYDLIDVTVDTDDGPQSVQMYLPPDDIAVGDGSWSLDHWVQHYEGMAVLAATELFAHDPALSAVQIRASWHMIEHRAWVKWTAMQDNAPSTLRRTPRAGDVEVVRRAPPFGSFFRFQQFEVRHRQFDGAFSNVLQREVFAGSDAAIVLPYDPKRDRILLVEQVRMGPILRQDPNPWMLEPIAGMVDARETPEQAAMRESIEEAKLMSLELRHLSSFYPSPGSSTDYFHAYLGLCDLPDDHATSGGLDSEAEDLRLHLISYDRAMALVASGEINTGPLVMMLSMLGAQRNALRNSA